METIRDRARQQLAINERDWRTRGMLSSYLANLGEADAARVDAQRAIRDSSRHAESLYYAAIVEVLSGQPESALDFLEQSVEQDGDFRHLIANDPDLNRLEAEPRFQALMTPPTGS